MDVVTYLLDSMRIPIQFQRNLSKLLSHHYTQDNLFPHLHKTERPFHHLSLTRMLYHHKFDMSAPHFHCMNCIYLDPDLPTTRHVYVGTLLMLLCSSYLLMPLYSWTLCPLPFYSKMSLMHHHQRNHIDPRNLRLGTNRRHMSLVHYCAICRCCNVLMLMRTVMARMLAVEM